MSSKFSNSSCLKRIRQKVLRYVWQWHPPLAFTCLSFLTDEHLVWDGWDYKYFAPPQCLLRWLSPFMPCWRGTTFITIVLVFIVPLWFSLFITYFPNLWTRILLKKQLFVHIYAIFIQTSVHIYFILWDIIRCHHYCYSSSCSSTGTRRPFTLTPVWFLLVLFFFKHFFFIF